MVYYSTMEKRIHSHKVQYYHLAKYRRHNGNTYIVLYSVYFASICWILTGNTEHTKSQFSAYHFHFLYSCNNNKFQTATKQLSIDLERQTLFFHRVRQQRCNITNCGQAGITRNTGGERGTARTDTPHLNSSTLKIVSMMMFVYPTIFV